MSASPCFFCPRVSPQVPDGSENRSLAPELATMSDAIELEVVPVIARNPSAPILNRNFSAVSVHPVIVKRVNSVALPVLAQTSPPELPREVSEETWLNNIRQTYRSNPPAHERITITQQGSVYLY
jgi:hypothetical protein